MLLSASIRSSILLSLGLIFLSFGTGISVMSQIPGKDGTFWFKGNTHTHAKFSDENDENDVPEIAGWYKDKGYNFLCLSEHNDHLEEKKIFCHDELSLPPDFIMICGNELSRKRHHTALGIDAFIGTESSLQDGVTKTIEGGGIPILNHPMSPVTYASDFISTKGLNHLEIINGTRKKDISRCEMLWDTILSAPGGRIVYGVAADDNHYSKSGVGKGWIMVNASKLTTRDILENIKKGNFYATSGIILNDYEASVEKVSLSTSNGDTIRFIGKNGTILKTVIGKDAEYNIRGNEKYVRARITNAEDDIAFTQPFPVK